MPLLGATLLAILLERRDDARARVWVTSTRFFFLFFFLVCMTVPHRRTVPSQPDVKTWSVAVGRHSRRGVSFEVVRDMTPIYFTSLSSRGQAFAPPPLDYSHVDIPGRLCMGHPVRCVYHVIKSGSSISARRRPVPGLVATTADRIATSDSMARRLL